jgi:regulatory protein
LAELAVAGIAPVKRKKGWFELEIRGKPPFFIDEETIIKNGLKVGDIISESKFKRIKEQADLAWLKYRGMLILSRRMLSERDLKRKLSAERRPAALRDQAMADLKAYGFYNDAKYAAALIRFQMARGVKSKIYLKKKLWEKGIDRQIAQHALNGELAEFDERTAVLELARKKFRSLRDLPPVKARTRLVTFLRAKGFSWDIIREAVNGAIGEEEGYD